MSYIVAHTPDSEYGISIKRGLLGDAGNVLRGLSDAKKVVLITDNIVHDLHGKHLRDALRDAGFEPVVVVVPSGEDQKTLTTVSGMLDQILSARVDRRTPVIGLGGGVITDMAGFVASLVLRGVPYIAMPTTLLAMVDASVGGKTGVNHAMGKNLIGAFYQPDTVLIDPDTLATLPDRELRSGLAECIKHDIIRDGDFFNELENNIDRAVSKDIDFLSRLIAHNVMIKAGVVEADPYEAGERAHLNFGHTFGHAIETELKYQWTHGECVAVGMCAAVTLAQLLNMISRNDRDRIVSVIRHARLPTGGVPAEVDAILERMRSDKKVYGGKFRFILTDRIGHVVIRDDVPEELTRQAIASVLRTEG